MPRSLPSLPRREALPSDSSRRPGSSRSRRQARRWYSRHLSLTWLKSSSTTATQWPCRRTTVASNAFRRQRVHVGGPHAPVPREHHAYRCRLDEGDEGLDYVPYVPVSRHREALKPGYWHASAALRGACCTPTNVDHHCFCLHFAGPTIHLPLPTSR